MSQSFSKCSECTHKGQLINKYEKLIKLLQTKYKKVTKSLIQPQSLKSDVFIENKSSHSLDVHISAIQSLPTDDPNVQSQNRETNSKLALMLLTRLPLKALLKQSFQCIRLQAKGSSPMSVQLMKQPSQIQDQMHGLSSGSKEEEFDFMNKKLLEIKKLSSKNVKQLHCKVFQLELQNSKLQNVIRNLKRQVEQSEKKYWKETEKKRQSLETVAQQIKEKTQVIFELQNIIKKYQKELFTLSNVRTDNILIEDQDQLRKNCIRLENINDKLNMDLRQIEQKIVQSEKQNDVFKEQMNYLKKQNFQLKETNFELTEENRRFRQIKFSHQKVCQKLTKKIQKIKIIQKQLLLCQKNQSLNLDGKALLGSADIISMKNTQVSTDMALSRKGSIRELEAQQKIEAIFLFLFNIQQQNYEIHNYDLFDEEQKNLLNNHKVHFLQIMKSQKNQIKLKSQKILKKNLNQSDQVMYIESSKIHRADNSFFDILRDDEENRQTQKVPQKGRETSLPMKMLEMQIEKSKLVEKISQLKNLNMHIRSLVLNLLKTLDISNLTKCSETQRVLEVVFDFFEYSQEQKMLIFNKQQPKKKFWGII